LKQARCSPSARRLPVSVLPKPSTPPASIAAPGLVDLNVSLREPGYSRKGNIASETRAAAAGGVTSLCCPPRTKPVLDTSAVAELILDRAREAGHSKVYPIGALSKGLEGEQLAELIALRDAGCVAFTNGMVNFRSNRTLCRALEYAATFDLTVIFNSQDHDLAEGGLAHDGRQLPVSLACLGSRRPPKRSPWPEIFCWSSRPVCVRTSAS
jgi:dihydroorotase-like cyclic amidohydrolase